MRKRYFYVIMLVMAILMSYGFSTGYAESYPDQEIKPEDFPSLEEYYNARIQQKIDLIKNALIKEDRDMTDQVLAELSDLIQETVKIFPDRFTQERTTLWDVFNGISSFVDSPMTFEQLNTFFEKIQKDIETFFSLVEPSDPMNVILPGDPKPADHS
jgi:hypothetical protein